MQISCPQCNSLYQLQAQSLGMGVLKSLHCASCDHTFVARRTRRSTAAYSLRATGAEDPISVDSLDQLKRMVFSGEITENWEIESETGQWRALNTMEELASLFIVCSRGIEVEETTTTLEKKSAASEPKRGSMLKWGITLLVLAAAVTAMFLLK